MSQLIFCCFIFIFIIFYMDWQNSSYNMACSYQSLSSLFFLMTHTHTHTYSLRCFSFVFSYLDISSNKTWLIDTCWPFICFLMIYHVSRRVYCDFFPLKTSINIAYLIHQNCFQCQILCICGMLRTC